MSSDENVIAMPTDNSVASDSIAAKLIEVSRVAESLDTVLHDTYDGLNLFDCTLNVASAATSTTSSAVERKAASANNSDVRIFISLYFYVESINCCFSF